MVKTLIFSSLFLSSAFYGSILALVSSSVANAELLKPIQAQTIDLGTAHGIAYYTPEKDGYRVIATVATGSAAPVRFDTTLAEGQSAKLSVPANMGEPDIAIVFTRKSGQLNVETSQPADAVTASTR